MDDSRIAALEKQIEDLRCDHPKKEIRYRLASNNSKMFKRQCTRCGELFGAWIPHREIDHPEKIQPIDDDLASRYKETCRELKIELTDRKQDLERTDWQDWYHEYLLSPEWQEKRLAVLERCNGVCEGCGRDRASEVHHITYRNVGNEFLFELVGMCIACHKRYHRNDEAENARPW